MSPEEVAQLTYGDDDDGDADYTQPDNAKMLLAVIAKHMVSGTDAVLLLMWRSEEEIAEFRDRAA